MDVTLGCKHFGLIANDGITVIATFYNRRPCDAALKAAARGHKSIVLREMVHAEKKTTRMHHFEGKIVWVSDDKSASFKQKCDETNQVYCRGLSMSGNKFVLVNSLYVDK